MGSLSSYRYLLALFLLNLYLKESSGEPNTSFSFKNFGKDSNFTSQLTLFGDAKVANDNVSVQISGSVVSSAGSVIYKKLINFVDRELRKMVSFSTYFVFSMSMENFSMSMENGDGLAFIMVPVGFNFNAFDAGSMGMFGQRKTQFLAVEFGNVNGSRVGVDINSLVSVKVSNVSSIHLDLNSGEKLQAWVDYEASSKRFEVRLSKLGDRRRPVRPLLFYPIDLSKMWKGKNLIVGLSSSSGNSSQKCNLYSWSFRPRTVPHWMHSEPMNPDDFVEKGENVKVPKRSDCASKIIGSLIFGIGCGALGAFIVLFLWTVFGSRRPVVPEEYSVQAKEFEYKKFNVILDETIENGKK